MVKFPVDRRQYYVMYLMNPAKVPRFAGELRPYKLLELVKVNNVDISVLLDKCAFLFQFAVEPRYSNQHEYTEEEVKTGLASSARERLRRDR
jgi:hypothetical protein